jgi:hypothetical protein
MLRRALALLIVLHGSAAADTPRSAPAMDDRGALNLEPGSARLDVTLEVGMSIRAAGEPVSLAPDLYAGVTPELTLGLVHSGRALGLLDSGRGVCLAGGQGGCDPAYSGTGVDAWFTFLRAHGLELAARSRLHALRFADPLKLRLTLGVLGAYRRGWLGVRFDPHISLGLSNRDRGNAHVLSAPVEVLAGLGPHADVYLRTGVRGMIHVFDEQYAVPLGLGVKIRPGRRWHVGAQFVFRQLLGPLNSFKPRDLMLFAGYRFAPMF